jgi:tripartite-type tricarboxylate transporter receptor subunit TctC
LDPVAGVAANVLCIAVHPAVPAQSLKDFIAYSKANPASYRTGTPVSVRSSI